MTTSPSRPKIVGTITGDRITCVIDNRFRSFLLASDQGQKLADALRRDPQDIDEIRNLADVASYLVTMSFGRLEVDDCERLRLDGKVVDFGVTSHFLRVLRDGYDIQPVVRFIERVAENPEEDLANDLFAFLQAGNLPFTEDGCFLAFKRVRDDYFDFHSGTVHYPVGGTVSIPREDCAKHRTACGKGLHVCYFDYLPSFHGGAGRILICKVAPEDVTDIPTGGSQHKLKCCRMEVLGEIPEADAQAHFTTSVDRRYAPPAEEVDLEEGDPTGDETTTVQGPDPEFNVSEMLQPTAEEAEAMELEYVERIGAEDGFAWAQGDTIYDAVPSSGARWSLLEGKSEEVQEAYRRAFITAYDEVFDQT